MKFVAILMLGLLATLASAQNSESVFSTMPESSWVMESENAFVIEDKYPQAPVHLLVVSKEIIPNINYASSELLQEMMILARDAAKKYEIKESGYRIVINTNREGGQSVYHLHIHVLGARQMKWPPG
jgi:histidine triad (HIT) family protein